VKSPSAARKSRPRAAQLKLAGIATIQPDAPAPAEPAAAAEPAAPADGKHKQAGSKSA
jgi:ribonuclease-3